MREIAASLLFLLGVVCAGLAVGQLLQSCAEADPSVLSQGPQP